MRTFTHWTPRYVKDRLLNIWYLRHFPDRPWITPAAHDILECYLRETDVGLEFGSGRSTVWFAKRVANLASVESDPAWYEGVASRLASERLTNVKQHLFPGPEQTGLGVRSDYADVAGQFARDSLDFVLVDGLYRDACALLALEKIRPGGLLIIDNANWFLPSSSRSPASVRTEADIKGEGWKKFSLAVSSWRRIWTSNGVTDTALFLKPPG